MVAGAKARFEIGSEEDLTAKEAGDDFPIAINQWKMVADLLRDARGAVIGVSACIPYGFSFVMNRIRRFHLSGRRTASH